MPRITDPAILAEIGPIPSADSGNVTGLEDLGGGYKRNQVGKVFYQNQRGTLTHVSGPSDEMVKAATTTATDLSSVLGKIDQLDKQLRSVKTLGPTGILTDPVGFSVAKQTAKDLMLTMKDNPYGLGVLNGPDLAIMNDIISNPDALEDMAFRQRVIPMLRNVSSIVGKKYRTNEDAFKALGGMPRAMVPLYQAPDSRYSKEQWGKSGRIPQRQAAPAPKASGGLSPAEQAELAALKKRFGR
jgi:hypothetical protein